MTTDPLSEIRAREAARAWVDAAVAEAMTPLGDPAAVRRVGDKQKAEAAFNAEIDRLRAEVEAERERCAKVAEDAIAFARHAINDRERYGLSETDVRCWRSRLVEATEIRDAIRTLAPRLADDGGGK